MLSMSLSEPVNVVTSLCQLTHSPQEPLPLGNFSTSGIVTGDGNQFIFSDLFSGTYVYRSTVQDTFSRVNISDLFVTYAMTELAVEGEKVVLAMGVGYDFLSTAHALSIPNVESVVDISVDYPAVGSLNQTLTSMVCFVQALDEKDKVYGFSADLSR